MIGSIELVLRHDAVGLAFCWRELRRNMLRRGIRAVGADEDPGYPTHHSGAAVPTYSHDRVVSGVAPAATPEADRKLLREVARNVVAETVKTGLTAA
jgi:hypothetical protein